MTKPIETLSEKEKDTLRLIVRGHDAKSAARELDLSVHTINERLRAARRKLDVTSSREAARILLESEAVDAAQAPQLLVDKGLGDATSTGDLQTPPITTPGRSRGLWIGAIIMFIAAAAAITLALGGSGSFTPANGDAATSVSASAEDTAREAAARDWLALVDAEDWEGSFAAAGSTFREPNTVASWQAASELARGPLGAVVSRKVVGMQLVASPQRYHVVRFATDFENQAGVIESVTLQREDGALRVVGYFIN